MAESGLPQASVLPPDPGPQPQPPAYVAQTAPTVTAYPPPGYPPAQPGYPPGAYPPQPGYPPAGYVQPQGGYPPGAYPPPQPGYGPGQPATTNVVLVGGQPTTVIQQKKEGVNHALHFIISLFFWPWVLVWIILCITEEA